MRYFFEVEKFHIWTIFICAIENVYFCVCWLFNLCSPSNNIPHRISTQNPKIGKIANFSIPVLNHRHTFEKRPIDIWNFQFEMYLPFATQTLLSSWVDCSQHATYKFIGKCKQEIFRTKYERNSNDKQFLVSICSVHGDCVCARDINNVQFYHISIDWFIIETILNMIAL